MKFSQKELAEGICKQGQISRLENGEYTPGSDVLYKLSKKLNVSMDYFFIFIRTAQKIQTFPGVFQFIFRCKFRYIFNISYCFFVCKQVDFLPSFARNAKYHFIVMELCTSCTVTYHYNEVVTICKQIMSVCQKVFPFILPFLSDFLPLLLFRVLR